MKRLYIIRIIIVVVVAAGLVAAWSGMRSYLLKSSDFRITDIEILPLPEGTSFKQLSREKILSACSLLPIGLWQSAESNTAEGSRFVQPLGGSTASKAALLHRDSNMFKVNLKSVKRELESNPWIEKAEVRRRLPDRLEIRIQEREGVARLKIKGRFFLIDLNGIILPDVQNVPTYDYPVINIKDVGRREPEGGEKLESTGLKKSLRLLGDLGIKGFLDKYPVLTISPQGNNGIFLVLSREKVEVRFPDTGPDFRIDILEQLLVQLQDEMGTISYIDLRFSEPVIRKK